MLKNKITGVRSVDFKIEAHGHGVVNWNGTVSLRNDAGGKDINNHAVPKMRGFSNLSGKVKEANGYEYKKSASEIDVSKTPMYISQNCLRHHLFRSQSHDMHELTEKNVTQFLCTVSGLLRGFVIPSKQWKRKSPLLVEDLVEQDGNANFEQLSTSGARDSNSIFSKTTFGDTRYIGYGSINIEDLQFIVLDGKFDRAALNASKVDALALAKSIEKVLALTDPERSPKVTFNEFYVRKGTIFSEGEAGLLLNNDAIAILVDVMLNMVEELSIQQAKGWMTVTNLIVDYNGSSQMMRIKRNPDDIDQDADEEYAQYYAPQGE
jgi:hypothetical protein